MIDPRWEQLADILVNYSTSTRAGDRVLITMMEPHTWSLARAVHAKAVQVGRARTSSFSPCCCSVT